VSRLSHTESPRKKPGLNDGHSKAGSHTNTLESILVVLATLRRAALALASVAQVKQSTGRPRHKSHWV
jgi:hypothetical protein